MFVDLDLKKKEMDERDANERKRKREEEDGVKTQAKKEKEWKEQWEVKELILDEIDLHDCMFVTHAITVVRDRIIHVTINTVVFKIVASRGPKDTINLSVS